MRRKRGAAVRSAEGHLLAEHARQAKRISDGGGKAPPSNGSDRAATPRRAPARPADKAAAAGAAAPAKGQLPAAARTEKPTEAKPATTPRTTAAATAAKSTAAPTQAARVAATGDKIVRPPAPRPANGNAGAPPATRGRSPRRGLPPHRQSRVPPQPSRRAKRCRALATLIRPCPTG